MKFTKMHSYGNDYVYIDCTRHSLPVLDAPEAYAISLCRRHFGIGGDGLVLLCPCEGADFLMRIFDPDGTEAELCGNALQCSAVLFALSRGGRQERVAVMTKAGMRVVSIAYDGDKAVSVWVSLPSPQLLFSDRRILLGEQFFHASFLSFGNPHCVVFTEDLSDENFLAHAPLLEKHPLFPQRANVEFVKILSRSHIEMRTWERGCGETLSCSTGTGAAVIAACLQGLTDEDVYAKQPGGTIRCLWEREKGVVHLFSQAKIIFWGEIPDDSIITEKQA